MHTFTTVLDAERLEELAEDADAIDRAALTAIAFHQPKRLKEEGVRHRHRVRVLAERNSTERSRRALAEGEGIIERVKVLGGPK